MAATGANPFTVMAMKAIAAGKTGAMSRESIEWFREMSRHHKKRIEFDKIKKSLDKSAQRKTQRGGTLILFQYDAKYKEVLDYWDASPLAVPFDEDKETFFALNLHYAPIKARAFIFDQLIQTIQGVQGEAKVRARIKSIATSKWFAPLIHRYRKDHVRSSMLHIPYDQWQTALFLPTANFQKASISKVHADYRMKVK